MKRVIRNRATRAYLTPEGQWGDFRLAKHFGDVQEAMFTCHRQQLLDAVEMVLVMGQEPNEEFDIALPLSTKKTGGED